MNKAKRTDKGKNDIRDVGSTAVFADVSDFCCFSLILGSLCPLGTPGTPDTSGTPGIPDTLDTPGTPGTAGTTGTSGTPGSGRPTYSQSTANFSHVVQPGTARYR